MIQTIFNVIKNYMGTGIVTAVFLLCLSYLAFFEKDRVKRCVFVYMPLVVIIVFLCPLTYLFYSKISEAVTYYRLIWLIPVTPVIAYASASIVSGLKGIRRNVFIAAIACFIALSGKLMYTDTYMVRAQNIYHMPQAVVDICDALHVEGREVRVVLPEELMQFARQYDPCICLAYGREYNMGMYVKADDLRDAMLSENRDPELIGNLGTSREVHYIVVRSSEKFSVLPVNYEEYLRIDGYIIYKSTVLSTSV